MSPSDREELGRLKAERRDLVAEYGDKGQLHPMARAIGGLNPAAQRLYAVRRRIEEIEHRYRAPAPRATLIAGRTKSGGGLLYDVEFAGRRGKIGRSQGAPPHDFYVVEGDDITSQGHKTLGQALKAFAKGRTTP